MKDPVLLKERIIATEIKEKINILLVDDHPENLLALEAVLDAPHYYLIKANSGKEALKWLLDEDAAVILLDVHMPVLDGFETATLIKEREKTRHIPIIFLTAVNKADRYVFKGYNVGAVDYILKPFDADILKSKVKVFADLYLKTEQLKNREAALRQNEKGEHERKLLEQQKESRQRYQNLAEAIPQIVWTARPDGAVDYYNRRWFEYTGLSAEKTAGWGGQNVLHPDDLPLTMDEWQKAIHTGDPYEMECRLKKADGSYRWYLVRAVPERDGDDKVVAWLGTSTDIDEQKRSQETLRALVAELTHRKKEAEEANRLKSHFVSNVSHELRTPLNAIIGYAALLIDKTLGKINSKQEEALSNLQRNGKDLLNLINNLLDLSKIESEEVPLLIEPVDLKAMIEEICANVQSLKQGKEIEIRCPMVESLRPIHNDPFKIRQIISNLLSNAIKFTEKGSITISAGNREAPGGVLLSIEDTGIGMREEDIPSIFDPFRQIDGSITRQAGGTGLGLTIVKTAVEIVQGTIEVKSTVGKGSTFTVFLPDHAAGLSRTVESRPALEKK
jgi:PAS domain S-box-containing protein